MIPTDVANEIMKGLSGGSEMVNTPGFQSGEGGSIPTLPLHFSINLGV